MCISLSNISIFSYSNKICVYLMFLTQDGMKNYTNIYARNSYMEYMPSFNTIIFNV